MDWNYWLGHGLIVLFTLFGLCVVLFVSYFGLMPHSERRKLWLETLKPEVSEEMYLDGKGELKEY